MITASVYVNNQEYRVSFDVYGDVRTAAAEFCLNPTVDLKDENLIQSCSEQTYNLFRFFLS